MSSKFKFEFSFRFFAILFCVFAVFFLLFVFFGEGTLFAGHAGHESVHHAAMMSHHQHAMHAVMPCHVMDYHCGHTYCHGLSHYHLA